MEVHVLSPGIWVNLINLLVTLTAETMPHNFRGEVSRGHAETLTKEGAFGALGDPADEPTAHGVVHSGSQR